MIEFKEQQIFIENITRILAQRERNPRWLADKSGLDLATITRILTGSVVPTFPSLVAISKGLQVDLPWLLAEHKPNSKTPEPQSKEKFDKDFETTMRLEVLEKKTDLMLAILQASSKSK